MLVGAVRREAWIWLTQVGNPLAHCHEGVADVVPGVVVVVGVERGLGRGAMEPLMRSYAGESAEGAQEWIGGCALRDLFAADAVLLVSEVQYTTFTTG